MATIERGKLNTLYSALIPGAPIASEDLAALGISADLAVHYVRAGWLTRLARGVYAKPNDTLQLQPSLKLLERRLEGLHVGGKSALDWHGVRHYVSQRPVLQLYGWQAGKLPDWFRKQFPATYHRKRLFQETSEAPIFVEAFDQSATGPKTSNPERALLEVLSEVGVRQPLEEAKNLVESSYTLRANVLQELLKRCTSVKTVRLCLTLGQHVNAPWMQKLNPSDLPRGSKQPWVSNSASGLLVLKR